MTEEAPPDRISDAEALASDLPLEAEAFLIEAVVDATLLNTAAVRRRLRLAGLLPS